MPLSPSTLETSTALALAQAIAGLVPQDAIGALEWVNRRYGPSFSALVRSGLIAANPSVQIADVTVPSAPYSVTLLGVNDPSSGKVRFALGDVAGRTTHGANSNRATYTACQAQVVAAATTILFALEAGTTKTVRLLRVRVWNLDGRATAAAAIQFELFRTTAASTGGGLITPSPRDPNDTYSGIFRAGAPTTTPATGAAATSMEVATFLVPASATTQGASGVPILDFDYRTLFGKQPIIAAGVANGLALQHTSPGAGATGSFLTMAEFTEET
jgi:hypothetical protein